MNNINFKTADILLLILAIFLPPVAVFVRRGCDMHLCIDIALLFLFFIPSILYAWYVILAVPQKHV